MKEMHYFDDKIYSKEECDLCKKFNNNFTEIKERLLKERYADTAEYAKDAETLEELILIAKAFELGEAYAVAVADKELSDDERKLALYGFKNNINLVEQIKGGENLENLAILIEASTKEGFALMDYFDPTGSYINYVKLQQFLKS